MSEVNANVNDLDLEYQDVVKNPNDPQMQQISAEIPEKYKGKSTDELIDMHVNLEKVLARQGNELGQLRKTVDVQTSLLSKVIGPTQTEVKKPQVNAEKLLNDPVSAVNEVVGANPDVQGNAQRLSQLELQVAQNRFEASHPTFKDDVNNPDFQDWVMKSPVRQKLLVSLHSNYNFDAGNELWELWDEHNTAKRASEAARQGRVQAAGTVKAGGGEPQPKPVLSRQKLSELQLRAINGDPVAKQKWEDPEFQRMRLDAYAEGRVR